jgi:hypothetical protein
LSAILVEQALIQAKMPFHLIFDEDLNHLSPDTCKILILPNPECISDEQLTLIRRYVEAGGGGLVATEQARLYDQWHRLRVKPGLLGLVDNQAAAAPYQEEVTSVPAVAGVPTRKEFGRGRMVYVPAIEFDGPLPEAEPYFIIGPEFWKRPKNSKELVDAVFWATRGDIPMQVSSPEFLAANLVEQPRKRQRLIHLVNYNCKQVPSIKDIEVKCATPDGQLAMVIRLYSADLDSYNTLNFRMQGSNAVFTVPSLNAYCMIAVS